MKRTPHLPKDQAGVMLLEALIAIFIFSLGVLAIVGMQAIAAKQVTDAQYRSQASLLADQLLGAMWMTDRTVETLQSQFDSSSQGDGSTTPLPPGYAAWKNRVDASLPVPDDYPPMVTVSADGTATIVIRWRAPAEGTDAVPHKYIAIAKVM